MSVQIIKKPEQREVTLKELRLGMAYRVTSTLFDREKPDKPAEVGDILISIGSVYRSAILNCTKNEVVNFDVYGKIKCKRAFDIQSITLCVDNSESP